MRARLSILVVTPAPAGSQKGNRVTAERWARLLRQLGHRVGIERAFTGQKADVLIALHARRSAASVARFAREHPERPVVVALTGTDLYQELAGSPAARRAVARATRLVVLQRLGVQALPPAVRARARVLVQSSEAIGGPIRRRRAAFEVCVMGHLRRIKDPFRAALAARGLPEGSRLRILHVGRALEAKLAERARAEERRNPRYHWLGELPRRQALRVLARCRLLVLTSLSEGGANVISEALAQRVPVLTTRIAGSLGLLGARYPGTFPVGDTAALRALLERAERDPRFYGRLASWCRRLRPLVRPARERAAWARLLRELEHVS